MFSGNDNCATYWYKKQAPFKPFLKGLADWTAPLRAAGRGSVAVKKSARASG